MNALATMVLVETDKLKRTLALGMMFAAPLVVVCLQTAIWLRSTGTLTGDVDPWRSFATNVFSMWAVFMQPLFVALSAGLIYGVDHAQQGWLRLHLLPVPRWTIPAAKLAVVLGLAAGAMVVLTAGLLLGARAADGLKSNITLPAAVPLAAIAVQAVKVFAASLLVTAVQNCVSLRWSSLTLSLGVGIAGTFLALFAGSWEYGSYYPWLMPLHALHAAPEMVRRILWMSPVLGTVLAAATLFLAARRDPGRSS